MNRIISLLASCLAVGFVLLGPVAKATTFTTVGAPPSFLTLEIWIGPPGGELDPETPSQLAATIGPLGLNGTANATVALDGFGNGTLTFGGASLILDDVSQFIDLSAFDLGTTNVDLDSVGLNVVSDGIPVATNLWDLDGIGPPTVLDMELNQGSLTLHGHTGFLSLLDDPTVVDLNAEPVSVELSDVLGNGIGGTAYPTAISLLIPAIDIDLGEGAFGLPGLLFIRLVGEAHLVAVPEPGTLALLATGLVSLTVMGIRRRRRA